MKPVLVPAEDVRTSTIVRARLKKNGASFRANDNIAEYLQPGELENLRAEVQSRVQDLLESLAIDTANDHNTRGTADRVARMYLDEIFAGRYVKRPDVTDFPNEKNFDGIYTVGPVAIRSTCSHHLCPITGNAWIGVIPGARVIGLSKFSRLCGWVMSRPQIQEEATVQLAEQIEQLINPKALAVVVKSTHHCMIQRGVRETDTMMTTSVMRGLFFDRASARAEFLELIK